MKKILFLYILFSVLFGQITSLENQTIGHPDSTFKQLLRFPDNGGIGATLKRIHDGVGDTTALYVSYDSVKVAGVLIATSIPYVGTTIDSIYIDGKNFVPDLELTTHTATSSAHHVQTTDTFVTNKDSHDHVGGDGAQIDHDNTANVSTSDHHIKTVDTNLDSAGVDALGFPPNLEFQDSLLVHRTAIDFNTAKVTNTDDQTIDVFSGSVNTINLSLENDGEATKTLDISGFTAIAANTAKNTNVPTALSVGTVGTNTVAITSDGGADDVTLPAATVTTAGMLTTAKWGEIVANNAKVTNTDDQVFDVSTLSGNTLSLSLEDDGEATKTFDISSTTAVTANTAKVTYAQNVRDGGVSISTAPSDMDFLGADFIVVDTGKPDSVNISIVDSGIDHDQTTNFVGDEHIDWKLSTQGTIHATNYVDNNTQLDSSGVDALGFVPDLEFGTHTGNTSNPHSVTATQVGLGNVDDVGTDDTAYNATSWNTNLDAATKNVIRDKVETMDTAIGLNTSKVTNVSTSLTLDTPTSTTVPINSDGSSPDITLIEATTSTAGLLGADKWDEIVANTVHIGSNGTDHSLLGATPGTATASIALIVDVNKDITLGTGDFTTTGLTATGTISLVATSFNENNITNVGTMDLDIIDSDGSSIILGNATTNKITLTDNTSIVVALGSDAGDDFIVSDSALVVSGDNKNIGISISEPYTKLHINGDLAFNPREQQALVSFVFDDNDDSIYDVMKPLFDGQGEVACAALVSSYIDGGGKLSTAEVLTLEGNGWEMLSHTEKHANLTTITSDSARIELSNSKVALEALGLTVNNFVYPNYANNESVRRITREYYRSARARGAETHGDDPTLNPHVLNNYILKCVPADDHTELATFQTWVDNAESGKRWLIFTLHTTTTDDSVAMNTLINYIQGKDIPIVTINQGLDLVGNMLDIGDHFAVQEKGVKLGDVFADSSFNFFLGEETGSDFIVDTTTFIIEGDQNRVGVGTATPKTIFNVKAPVQTLSPTITGLAITNTGFSTGTYSGGLGFGLTTGDLNSGIVGTFETADNNQMGLAFLVHPLATGGSNMAEAVRIDEGGNLGIGTTTPDEKFEVEWSANVDVEIGVGTSDTDITFIKLRSPDGTPYWLYPANGGGSLTISATKP